MVIDTDIIKYTVLSIGNNSRERGPIGHEFLPWEYFDFLFIIFM